MTTQKAWYMVDAGENDDFKDLLMTDPPSYVSFDDLYSKTGVEYFNFDAETWDTNPEYAKLKKVRGYTYDDVIEISRETLPNYDDKMKMFFKEHIHSDEEIRYIIAGSGFFDVRDNADKWIRIHVTKNDMLVLPAGIYHRFTIDKGDYLKAKRLFVGEPVWTPINRPCDDHLKRQEYVQQIKTAKV